MALKFTGPWKIRSLGEQPISQIPDVKGDYLISIPKEKYNQAVHGSSRFIYIGGMSSSENASLSKRLGEFFAATFGFSTYHSAGNTFFATRKKHQINPWDLEIWWVPCDDPKCGEAQLFQEYEKDFNDKPFLNKIWKRTGCEHKHKPIEIKVPWRE